MRWVIRVQGTGFKVQSSERESTRELTSKAGQRFTARPLFVNFVNGPSERDLEIAADGNERDELREPMQQIEELTRVSEDTHPWRVGHAMNRGVDPFASAMDQAVPADVAGGDGESGVHNRAGNLAVRASSVVINL